MKLSVERSVKSNDGGHTSDSCHLLQNNFRPLSEVPAEGQQQQKLTVEDSLSLLAAIKRKFYNRPKVYNDFVNLLHNFKSHLINATDVIEKVSNLFNGHPDLIIRFNLFLPSDKKIVVQSNDLGIEEVDMSISSPLTSVVTVSPVNQCHDGAVEPEVMNSLSISSGKLSPPNSSAITLVQPHLGVDHINLTSGPQLPCVPYDILLTPAPRSGPDHPFQWDQPFAFNYAMKYVNKIKKRFQEHPEKYRMFLRILHTYQMEEKSGKQPSEFKVYRQVANILNNEDDLLAEFEKFFPFASKHKICDSENCSREHPHALLRSPPFNQKPMTPYISNTSAPPVSCVSFPNFGTTVAQSHFISTSAPELINNQHAGSLKRTRSFESMNEHHSGPSHYISPKKHKVSTSFQDVCYENDTKYDDQNDYDFFDDLHRSLQNRDVYKNFLRCITLFNQKVVSKPELVSLVSPLFSHSPELFRRFKEIIGDFHILSTENGEMTPPQQDCTTCEHLGASYCALPKNYIQPICSGRTSLCKEVLNDTWVTCRTCSKGSTFVASKKTQYENYIYRCEDERFEMDAIIDTNAATIIVLEGVLKKLHKLSTEEISHYKLDNCLGGNSATIHQRAIKRLYGDKSPDVIEGLKKIPSVVVPIVLSRLKAKEKEWKNTQKELNKVWNEQNEKFYLKSLDHKGISFRRNDIQALTFKSLLNEIETCYSKNHMQADGITVLGPHLVLSYESKSILDDAANLLIHHVEGQTGIHKKDKQKIKNLLKRDLPDLFYHQRQLSEAKGEDMYVEPSSKGIDKVIDDYNDRKVGVKGRKLSARAFSSFPEECYRLFFSNTQWYLFMRYHQILCERLTKIYERALLIGQDEPQCSGVQRDSTLVAIQLKPKIEVDISELYTAFLDTVRDVSDGNIALTTYCDRLREMFGIHAYIAFTLDKVILYAVTQLQHLVSNKSCTECVDMYVRAKKRGGAGGLCRTAKKRISQENAYQCTARTHLAKENCFRMYIYKHKCTLNIELLHREGDADAVVNDTEK